VVGACSESGQDAQSATTTSTSAPQQGGEGSDVLTLGALVPETGELAFLGPGLTAAVALAIADVNEAGGVLSSPVELAVADEGEAEGEQVDASTETLLREGVDGIVGPASSVAALHVIDQVTGSNVLLFSPANTASELTDYDDSGLYFRTAPSDVLQGEALAQALGEDGAVSVSIAATEGDYGEQIADFTADALEAEGTDLATTVLYDPADDDLADEVEDLVAADADAVLVAGFEGTGALVQEMVRQGIGPTERIVYGANGSCAEDLIEAFADDLAALQGMKCVVPGAPVPQALMDRLQAAEEPVEDPTHAPEAYDAVVITALAAESAGTDDPLTVAAEVVGVTTDGTPCETYAGCLALLGEGEDIDYQGQSGAIELSEEGDPTVASFAVDVFGPEGRLLVAEREYLEVG